MKVALSIAGIVFAFAAIGCSGSSTDMTKADEAKFKNPPPMTDANRKQMTDAMASGAEKEKAHEREWRAQPPEEAKKMDAERAAKGLPPLGQ